MNILFLHQNFPGQYAHLAPALAASGHRAVALTSRIDRAQDWRGVRVVPYAWSAAVDQRLHPWMTTLNAAVHRGAEVFRAATRLAAQGFAPDVILVHSGWGEGLFLRDVWPEARIGVLTEFSYRAEGADIGFDPEFDGSEIGRGPRVAMKNLAMRLQLEAADAGIAPTHWQARGWPADLAQKIAVIHDGIDTAALTPDPAARLTLPGGRTLSRSDEVILFAARNLEPYRGFHVFMRALPDLLRRRPAAQVLIVGEDGNSYGPGPDAGGTWRDLLTAEVRGRIADADWARVHFAGRLPREGFTAALQVARVHVYLTYPFVLSWSLLESMACEGVIVASDTAPVTEVLEDGRTALLGGFFDGAGMVDRIARLADDADLRRAMGRAARRLVRARYDLKDVCLPAQMDWIDGFSGQSPVRDRPRG